MVQLDKGFAKGKAELEGRAKKVLCPVCEN
jgi:hypothetical protein